MLRPHYDSNDSHCLIADAEPSAYMRLGSKQLPRLLHAMRETGRIHRPLLRAYPEVRCEALEFFYQCRRAMDALDTPLFQDLMHCYTWREANWAAWLAALVPRPEWVADLRQKRPQLVHATLTIDLALMAAGDAVAGDAAEHLSALIEVREMLHELPAMPYPMRRALTEQQQPFFDAERAAVHAAYRIGGFDAARPLLHQGLIAYYRMSRGEWLQSGPAPASAWLTSPYPSAG